MGRVEERWSWLSWRLVFVLLAAIVVTLMHPIPAQPAQERGGTETVTFEQ